MPCPYSKNIMQYHIVITEMIIMALWQDFIYDCWDSYLIRYMIILLDTPFKIFGRKAFPKPKKDVG
jgi:hypothetical protein